MDDMRLLRWAAVLAVVTGLLYAGYYQAQRSLKVPYYFDLEAHFTTLPADDRQLADWLKDQPGVMGGVGIGRLDDGRVRVLFRQSRNLLGEPPVPQIDEVAAAFGYIGVGRFRSAKEESISQIQFYE